MLNLRPTTALRKVAVECHAEWHYGTIGPRVHTDPEGPSGWRGIHGAPTRNWSGLCDECEQDQRDNYPGRAILPWRKPSSNAALQYAAEPINWDNHDPWGSGMTALGAVCDVMFAMGASHLIEPGAGYRPGMGQSADLDALADADEEDGQDWATVSLAGAVRSGDVTVEDLARASRILHLYLDLVTAAGRDY